MNAHLAAGVAVRRATALDVDLIAPLFDAYRQFYRKPPDRALARSFLLDRFRRNESILFLAALPDGSAAGFAQLYPSFSSAAAAPVFILNDLYVEPAARRRGVGARLLSAAATFGREIGAVRLVLSTEVGNSPAQGACEKEGWVRQTDFFVYTLPLV